MQAEIIKTQAEELSKTSDEADIRAQVERGSTLLIVVALTSFLMTWTYLLHWWVGDNWASPMLWDSQQMLYGLGATMAAASLAFAEYHLYQFPVITTLFYVARIVVFASLLVTETANTLNREDERVHHQSQNSAVFKAVVESIGTTSAATAAAASSASPETLAAAAEKAKHQAALSTCGGTKSCNAARSGVAQAQAKLDASAAVQASGGAVAAAQITALANKANDLAYDERNFSGITKVMSNIFGTSPLTTALILSLLFISSLQLAFIALGRTVAIARAALPRAKSVASLRTGTQNATQHANPDTQIAATDNEVAALNTIWNEIDAGRITQISVRNDGQIAQTLKDKGYGSTNAERKELVDFVVDALRRESVLIGNPGWVDGADNGRRPQYIINPDRKIKYNHKK
ncbi:hypothetical protein [Thiothrix sp.]|jgi:hypothetical protein|uniref:hypothetical protein n=1 Tax=Thiothrix sp. TaxID=1032 RepID=UPI00257A7B79|nr:hypothetical protein [Thiothrix sp.]